MNAFVGRSSRGGPDEDFTRQEDIKFSSDLYPHGLSGQASNRSHGSRFPHSAPQRGREVIEVERRRARSIARPSRR
jgi:hypothetical protein